MRMACAECGCVVDAGTRVSVCADAGCCCATLPTLTDADMDKDSPGPARRWRREDLYDRPVLSPRPSP